MYLLIILLPLLNFIYLSLFGRFLGKYGSMYFAVFFITLTVPLAIYSFIHVGIKHNTSWLSLGTWINSEMLIINWGFIFDSLTVTMFVVVTLVSTLVHIYSCSYMGTDPHVPRFLSYLSLFTFFMLILVSADNFLQLFLGWEGVGLCSYLLINFWFTRIQANKSAIKAMVLNRIGDFGFFLGILVTFFIFRSLNFYNVFLLTPYIKNHYIVLLNSEINILQLMAFLFFIGSIGKSSQVGLHTWLPDAMEGPTPVSALIHAATMVTAGVFLIIRCSIIFEYAPAILTFCTFSGAITAFFAATIGVLQNDIKKVIAFSTCSQLGYMVFICGLSNYSLSLFHLFNHAFFKALLFLGAGSLIHSLNNEQDMRNMGGLMFLLPYTYSLMLIGSLALMGFPFLAGFYSKDIILEVAFVNYTVSSKFAYILGTIAAFFTAFYSIRLLFLVFIKTSNSFKFYIKNLHEMDIITCFTLTILGLGSIFSGYIFKDLFIGLGSDFFSFSIFTKPEHLSIVDSEFIPFDIKLIPTVFSFFGSALAVIFYTFFYTQLIGLKFTVLGKNFYKFLNKKWYFDLLYNIIAYNILKFSYNFTFKAIDKGVIEIFGPKGFALMVYQLAKTFQSFQTGYIYHYTCILIINFIIIFFFSI